jgi:hypothetical protein
MRESGRLAEDVDLYELAELSKNYSGAEIAAVVRSATNFVVAANFDDDMRFKDENLVIDMDSFKKALGEVYIFFRNNYYRGGIYRKVSPPPKDRCVFSKCLDPSVCPTGGGGLFFFFPTRRFFTLLNLVTF